MEIKNFVNQIRLPPDEDENIALTEEEINSIIEGADDMVDFNPAPKLPETVKSVLDHLFATKDEVVTILKIAQDYLSKHKEKVFAFSDKKLEENKVIRDNQKVITLLGVAIKKLEEKL